MSPELGERAVSQHLWLSLGIGLAALAVGGGLGLLTGILLRLLARVAPTFRALLYAVPARSVALAVVTYALFLLYFDVDVLKSAGLDKSEPGTISAMASFVAMSCVAFVLAASRTAVAVPHGAGAPSLLSGARDILFVCAFLAACVDLLQGSGGLASLARNQHAHTFSLDEPRWTIAKIALVYLPVDLLLGAVTTVLMLVRRPEDADQAAGSPRTVA